MPCATHRRSPLSPGSPRRRWKGSPNPSSSSVSPTTTTRRRTASTTWRRGGRPTGSASPTGWRHGSRWSTDGSSTPATPRTPAGCMGATTVRLGLGDATFTAVGLDDLRQPVEISGAVAAFVQTVGGRTAVPGAPPREAPALRPAPGAGGVDDAHAQPAGRRVGLLRGGGSVAVPPPLDLRRRRRLVGQGRRGRLPGLVPRRAGSPHARGATRTRRRWSPRSRRRWNASCPPRSCARAPSRTLRSLKTDATLTTQGDGGRRAVPAARRRAGRRGRRRRWWPRSAPARWWASGPSWRADGAPRPCGRSPRCGWRWPAATRSSAEARWPSCDRGHRREEAAGAAVDLGS